MTRSSVTFTLVRPTTPTRWPGRSLIALIFDLAGLRGRLRRRVARGPEHDDILAQDGDRLGAVGHLLIRARDRKIGIARGEHRNRVHRARGRDHGKPHRGSLLREMLRQSLDQLLVAASRWPDGDPQGGRPQQDEGRADDRRKHQQAGGEHQEWGTLVSPAANFACAGLIV